MTQNIAWNSPQGIQADYQMEMDALRWDYEDMGFNPASGAMMPQGGGMAYNPQTGLPYPAGTQINPQTGLPLPAGQMINPQTGQPMIRPAMVAPSRLPTNLSKFAMPALLIGGGVLTAWLLTRK